MYNIFRMDDDQCARRNLQLFFGIRDPDYYEFEGLWFVYKIWIVLLYGIKYTHIFQVF